MKASHKPEEFEAVQYTGDNPEEVISFIGLEAKTNGTHLTILDPSGDWNVHLNQWVLKTLEGKVLGTVEKDHFWNNFATLDEEVS
jgi:hypothetical protein